MDPLLTFAVIESRKLPLLFPEIDRGGTTAEDVIASKK